MESFFSSLKTERVGRKTYRTGARWEVTLFLRGPLRHLVESRFDFDRLRILNIDKTKALIEGFRRGSNTQTDLIWRLVSLNYWLGLN
jgi:hypothetical protein